jgi:hypothetical protein
MGNGCSDGSCGGGNKNRVEIENSPSNFVPSANKPLNVFPNSVKGSNLPNSDDF